MGNSGHYQEKDFEDAVELGFINNGYHRLDPKDYSREKGLFIDEVIKFVRETQEAKWDELVKKVGNSAKSVFIETLIQSLQNSGSLRVIRKGIKCKEIKFDLVYFKPPSMINTETWGNYKKNRFGVVRQFKFSTEYEGSVDIGLVLNGIPIITMELKNNMTGQSYKHAIEQYKNDREPSELLFQFNKRALVHFAYDTELIYMTTKLDKKDTFFLPFNKGLEDGKGNPTAANGEYATSYLWKEVLTKDSLLDIIQKFLQINDGKLIFPRYHQLDVVRKLEHDCRKNGIGQNYLIQHSAGSGKSNSISWLANRLYSLSDYRNDAIFNTIFIITDRKALDRQIRDNVKDFEKVKGLVGWASKSKELAELIQNDTKIIVTTIHKFSYILGALKNQQKKRYAVIIDEAHSSQKGELSKSVREGLTNNYQADDEELKIANGVKGLGKKSNVSFFAFTATPIKETLQTFGWFNSTKNEYEPYHVYSMKQAIQEGFIHDVLKNYVTYQTYYTVRAKNGEEELLLDEARTKRQISKKVSTDKGLIREKTRIMLSHFWFHTKNKLMGKAKAMIVTSGIKEAIFYKLEIDRQIAEKGFKGIKTIVAFSGEVNIDGKKYSEESMNGIKETELTDTFNQDDFKILIVANKYQTGFNQPLLHTMYVDKALHDINAVQTLSRLNRTNSLKEDTFILDFRNDIDDIRKSFEKYYKVTQTGAQIDNDYLINLKRELFNAGVFTMEEVTKFVDEFKKSDGKHAVLNDYIQVAVRNYNELEEKVRNEFKSKVKTYAKSYSYLAQILSIKDKSLKELQTYCKVLHNALYQKEIGQIDIKELVEIEKLRLAKTFEGIVELVDHGGIEGNGSGGISEKVLTTLETIVREINDKFNNAIESDEYSNFFEIVLDRANKDDVVVERAKTNVFKVFYDTNEFQKIVESVVTDSIYLQSDNFDDDIKKVSNEMMSNVKFSNHLKFVLADKFYQDIHQENINF